MIVYVKWVANFNHLPVIIILFPHPNKEITLITVLTISIITSLFDKIVKHPLKIINLKTLKTINLTLIPPIKHLSKT
jgi:hypothetical protein